MDDGFAKVTSSISVLVRFNFEEFFHYDFAALGFGHLEFQIQRQSRLLGISFRNLRKRWPQAAWAPGKSCSIAESPRHLRLMNSEKTLAQTVVWFPGRNSSQLSHFTFGRVLSYIKFRHDQAAKFRLICFLSRQDVGVGEMGGQLWFSVCPM